MNNEWTTGIDDLSAENKELLKALKWLINVYCCIGSKGEDATDSEFAINNGKSTIVKVGELMKQDVAQSICCNDETKSGQQAN